MHRRSCLLRGKSSSEMDQLFSAKLLGIRANKTKHVINEGVKNIV